MKASGVAKSFFGRTGRLIAQTKDQCQRSLLRWRIMYSPDEIQRFSILTIIPLMALIILVLCVVEETKNIVLNGESSLMDFVPLPTIQECNSDYISSLKSKLMDHQDDPCVIDYIRQSYLRDEKSVESRHRVAKRSTRKRLRSKRKQQLFEMEPSYEDRVVAKVVVNYMQHRGRKQKEGFFVECCGTALSSSSSVLDRNLKRAPSTLTLQLETFWDWSGLLIHSDSDKFGWNELIRNQKKNTVIPTCLNLDDDPNSSTAISVSIPTGKVYNNPRNGQHNLNKAGLTKDNLNLEGLQDYCLPLYSILLASNQTQIDFLSLMDLGRGNELDFLRNIPWNNIDIKLVGLKVSSFPDVVERAVLSFMESVGFSKYTSRYLKGIGEILFLVKKEEDESRDEQADESNEKPAIRTTPKYREY